MRGFVGISLLTLCLSGCQTAGTSGNFVSVAGKPIKLGYYMQVNPDCTPIGKPTIRIIQAPQNGSLKIVTGSDFPYFFRSNVRSVCNTKRVASEQVYYTANTSGSADTVTIEVIYTNGANRVRTFNIQNR